MSLHLDLRSYPCLIEEAAEGDVLVHVRHNGHYRPLVWDISGSRWEVEPIARTRDKFDIYWAEYTLKSGLYEIVSKPDLWAETYTYEVEVGIKPDFTVIKLAAKPQYGIVTHAVWCIECTTTTEPKFSVVHDLNGVRILHDREMPVQRISAWERLLLD
jgi:hypothetical protein